MMMEVEDMLLWRENGWYRGRENIEKCTPWGEKMGRGWMTEEKRG